MPALSLETGVPALSYVEAGQFLLSPVGSTFYASGSECVAEPTLTTGGFVTPLVRNEMCG